MLLCITADGKVSALLIQSLIEDFLAPYADKEFTSDHEEQDLINQILAADIPVYDLARGMFPRMPLDGAESQAETTGAPDPSPSKGSESEHGAIDYSGLDLTTDQIVEIEKRIMATIRIRETHNLHYTNAIPDNAPKKATEEDVKELLGIDPVDNTEETNDKQKYWQSKGGKIRLARKSKPRPGETEVYLTQEEADERMQ